MTWWRTLRQPTLYHGQQKSHNFFEGWYYKIVDSGQQHRYAIIPGVFLDDGDGRESHAFIQVLDGMRAHATYTRFPLEAFQASATEFDVRIGPNHFRADRIALALDTPERKIQGALQFTDLKPWPVTLAAPGIMGWYAYLPFMQCYHGIVSLDHGIVGELAVDGQVINFDGGRGYGEKDWGQAFPSAYIWMQSNHFATPGTSLTASVAVIPMLSSAFRGVIAGLLHEGRLYRFATYTGALIDHLRLTDTHVEWQISGPVEGQPYRLSLQADRAEGGLLHSPERAVMLARVAETMTASVEVRLVALEDGREREVFAGRGDCACLETVGELDLILDRD
ncbi:MAG: hypothetical protein JXN59_05125 [Anaerolineae bacterium]|nr:hypothetical protein [Anaerolineae bacterium]